MQAKLAGRDPGIANEEDKEGLAFSAVPPRDPHPTSTQSVHGAVAAAAVGNADAEGMGIGTSPLPGEVGALAHDDSRPVPRTIEQINDDAGPLHPSTIARELEAEDAARKPAQTIEYIHEDAGPLHPSTIARELEDEDASRKPAKMIEQIHDDAGPLHPSAITREFEDDDLRKSAQTDDACVDSMERGSAATSHALSSPAPATSPASSSPAVFDSAKFE